MRRMVRNGLFMTIAAAAILAAACGGRSETLKEVQRVRSSDLNIVLLSEDGTLNRGKDAFVIEFQRPDGSLVDVGNVTTSANMPMPGMTMAGSVRVDRSDVPGRYTATGDFGMAGGWQMKVAWNGPAGQGDVSFEGNVQ
jgi:YtkA-like